MEFRLEDVKNPLIRRQIQSQLKVVEDKKTSKYKNEDDFRIINNVKHKFDSKREARCFDDLFRQLKLGMISQLKLQPKYLLIPTLNWNETTLRKISYIADFEYLDKNGNKIAVDAKGFQTDVYKLKKRLFIQNYPDYKLVEV